MDKSGDDEYTCRVVCQPCGAIFYRETVYHGLGYGVKCPRCSSKDIKIVVKDVTKLIEG